MTKMSMREVLASSKFRLKDSSWRWRNPLPALMFDFPLPLAQHLCQALDLIYKNLEYGRVA